MQELTDAVARALLPAQVSSATRTRRAAAVARGICRTYRTNPDCLCGGDPRRCHATTIYADMAAGVVTQMEKEGVL